MKSVTEFIEHRLKLRVNRNKSAVDSPVRRKFLGFTFYWRKGLAQIRLHQKPIERLKEKVRVITSRSKSMTMEARINKLNALTRGWVSYYRPADMSSRCRELDKWIRARLRMCYWKQWKCTNAKYENLRRLGLSDTDAWRVANTRKGYWRTAGSPTLMTTLTIDFFSRLGLLCLSEAYQLNS
jgi:hypothetical protein